MLSRPEQIKEAVLQFLKEKKIAFQMLMEPAFHTKKNEAGKPANDYWVVPYTYIVFQEEEAYVYADDTKQEVLYAITPHGYIYPGREEVIKQDDGEDWDDL